MAPETWVLIKGKFPPKVGVLKEVKMDAGFTETTVSRTDLFTVSLGYWNKRCF